MRHKTNQHDRLQKGEILLQLFRAHREIEGLKLSQFGNKIESKTKFTSVFGDEIETNVQNLKRLLDETETESDKNQIRNQISENKKKNLLFKNAIKDICDISKS